MKILRKIIKIYFFLAALIFLSISAKICQQKIFDENPQLFQCSNCGLVSEALNCSKNCLQSEQQYYYSGVLNQCAVYKGEGYIQSELDSKIYCIDGFIRDSTSDKCSKKSTCPQGIFNQDLNLFLCSDCFLVSDISYCDNSEFIYCKYMQYYSGSYCYYHCGNGIIFSSITEFDCGNGQNCIEGFKWDPQNKYCKKCDQIIINQNFNIYQCPNCSYASEIALCNNNCKKQQYFSKIHGCFTYQESGQITTSTCVDGFFWNSQTSQCQKNCSLMIIDSNLNIYRCENCTFSQQTSFCNNFCEKSQFYSGGKNKCMDYCGNGRVIDDKAYCESSTTCIDGYLWDSSKQECTKCDNSIFSDNQNLFVNLIFCQYCDLVLSKQPQNCGKCNPNYFYSSNLNKCFFYCGNGIIANNAFGCPQSNSCIDSFQWNSSTQKCEYKCTQGVIDTYLNLIQCENCSYTSNNDFCTNPCRNYQYYSQTTNGKCMNLCRTGGQISENSTPCELSNQCVDGFMWSTAAFQCVKEQQPCNQGIVDQTFKIYQCSNCILVSDTQLCQNTCQNSEYLSQYLNYKCMKMCQKGKITGAQESCENSNLCVDGFKWNSLTKICEQQQTCNKAVFDPILKIYQCPNCSLVTDTLLCNNMCQISQFYSSQNQCMTYCGNGIIAKDISSCKQSNTCIDGLANCNQSQQTESQSQQYQNNDQSQLIIYILIASLAILLIILVYCTIKHFKLVIKIQQLQLNKTETQFDQMKEKFEQEIQAIHQKIEKKEQTGIQSQEIIPTFNQKSKSQDLEDQPIEEQTIFNCQQNDNNQYDQTSQQHLQSNPVLQNQESQ